jgi:hypothetical protein
MKLKTTVLSAIFVFAMGLLGAGATSAAEVVFDPASDDRAIGITDLDIDGTFYDVDFISAQEAESVYGDLPGEFDFNTKDSAQAAINAVTATLNTEGGVLYVGSSGGRNNVAATFYSVAYASETLSDVTTALQWRATGQSGTWISDIDTTSLWKGDPRTWAIFTLVDDPPEPTIYDVTGIWHIEGQEDYFSVNVNGSNMVGVTYFPGAGESFWLGYGVENDWYIYYASNLTEFGAYFVLTSDTTGIIWAFKCSPSSECFIPVDSTVNVIKVF